MSNWIKAKDKKPKNNMKIILNVRYGFVCIGIWDEKNKVWEESIEGGTYQEDSVVAWCPIPEYDLND